LVTSGEYINENFQLKIKGIKENTKKNNNNKTKVTKEQSEKNSTDILPLFILQ
jgi:hypothetical protein